MGHGHGHGHAHGGGLTATGRHRGPLALALGISAGIAAAEVAGAIVSGSLVLLADAAHMALAGNGVSLLMLRRGRAESLNVRGAFLEVASDAFGAAAVVVSGLVISLTGFTLLDPIASVAVAVLILPRTWLLRTSPPSTGDASRSRQWSGYERWSGCA